eukprot:4461221-Prorocentrum_lima.AAC.1
MEVKEAAKQTNDSSQAMAHALRIFPQGRAIVIEVEQRVDKRINTTQLSLSLTEPMQLSLIHISEPTRLDVI